MLCLNCRVVGSGSLCANCRAQLRGAPERFVPGVGVVRSAFVHDKVARSLVHQLKYRGVVRAGQVLAEAMVPLVLTVAAGAVVVPVPRVGWRRLRYGVDPALELASGIARLSGRPLVRALRAPVAGRARAGGVHGVAPRFRLAGEPPPGPVLLVDDVVTTGATLRAAAEVLPRTLGAVTATGRV